MLQSYKVWLVEQGYANGTVAAQLHRVGRVEGAYGSLDEHHQKGTMQDVIDGLNYSVADERNNAPNPSNIEIEGNIRNNLQSYKNAVVRYRKFLTGWERSDVEPDSVAYNSPNQNAELPTLTEEYSSQKLSLERDMQKALRENIISLADDLEIIDDGAERSVFSGLIDITCKDREGNLVVLELKAGKADSRAIGQILGYMGDLADEEETLKVRGMLIAHDFDKRCKSAAKVVPSLKLVKYAINFNFVEEQ